MRDNNNRTGQIFAALLVGLVFAMVGWCLYQPDHAATLWRGFVLHVKGVFAGPFVDSKAPTLGQLWAYAWQQTKGLTALIFIAIWATMARVFFWIFEWGTKPR